MSMIDNQNGDKVNRRTILRNLGVAAGASILGTGVAAGTSDFQLSEESRQKGRSIKTALAKMNKHMQLDDENRLTVDEQRAESDHVSEHAQRVALDLAELNHLILDGIESGELIVGETGSKRMGELLDRFEPYFMLIATGETAPSPVAGSDDGSIGTSGNAGGCGGSKQDPHRCPDRYWSGVYRNSKQGIKDYLWDHGYHETAPYAAYETDIDWTKCVYAYGCGGCAFRSQALIRPRYGDWSLEIQRPEPNPEIHGYIWPNISWGEYVHWWHGLC